MTRPRPAKETRAETTAGIAINITAPGATLKPSSLSHPSTFNPQGGTCHLAGGIKVPIKVTLHPSILFEQYRCSPESPCLPLPRCYACSKGDSSLTETERKTCMLRATVMDLFGVIRVLKRNSTINLQRGDSRFLRYLGDEKTRRRPMSVKVQAMILPLRCCFRAPRVASNRRAIHTP